MMVGKALCFNTISSQCNVRYIFIALVMEISWRYSTQQTCTLDFKVTEIQLTIVLIRWDYILSL